MYNLTDINKRANENMKKNLQRIGKSMISSSVEINYNTPNILKLKNKLNKSNIKSEINNNLNEKSFPLNSKTTILIKDRAGNLQGHGLWCQDLSKVPQYNRNEVLDIMKSEAYSNPNFTETLADEANRKVIEVLKQRLSDVICKIEEAYSKYYESEYKCQRLETMNENYMEILQKKISENKALFEELEPLNNQIESLTEALGNSRKEIERLTIENKNLADAFERINKENEDNKIKNEKLKSKAKEADNEVEKSKQKISELNDRIDILQISLDRYTSKYQDKRDYLSPNNNTLSGSNSNNHNQKGKDQPEDVLRMQLQIVDLKKRLSEEEKIRLNLFEVIKAKKQKNKNLKNEINKIVSVFEESGKENKWSQDLIVQKDTIIKVLKEKIQTLTNENKNFNKQLAKYKIKPILEDKFTEANLPYNDEQYVQVNAFPNLFINNNKK